MVAPRSNAARSGSMTSLVAPEWVTATATSPRAELHGAGHGEVRVAVRLRDQPDARQLLRQVVGDQGGGADAVQVSAPGGGDRGDGGGELGGVEGGGGVGEGLLLLAGQLGDDVLQRVVDGDVRGERGGAAGAALGGEPGEGEPQVAQPE